MNVCVCVCVCVCLCMHNYDFQSVSRLVFCLLLYLFVHAFVHICAQPTVSLKFASYMHHANFAADCYSLKNTLNLVMMCYHQSSLHHVCVELLVKLICLNLW